MFLFHLSLSAVRGSICVLFMPASLNLFFQQSRVFLFLPLLLGKGSSCLFHPNTAIFGSMVFSILITCPILSRILFSIFHSMLLIPKMFRMSCIFTPMRFICGGSVFGAVLYPSCTNVSRYSRTTWYSLCTPPLSGLGAVC